MQVRVVGHNVLNAITGTAQTFVNKNSNLRLRHCLKPNVSFSQDLGCFSYGKTMTCNPA